MREQRLDNHKAIACFSVSVAAVLILLCGPGRVLAETKACKLLPDDRAPAVKILRCGDDLTVRVAPHTEYHLTGQQRPDDPPQGVELKSGGLMIDFKPDARQRNFQILTPHAIAAVRGTTWAVEVTRVQSSTLAVSGSVEVTRPDGSHAVILRAGQGADVAAGKGPISVERWSARRVQTLLSRFAQ